jgi:hypothetical protein
VPVDDPSQRREECRKKMLAICVFAECRLQELNEIRQLAYD